MNANDSSTAPNARGTGPPSPQAAKIGRWLLAFAVGGGIISWAVHLLVAWAVVEVTCARNRTYVGGLPLYVVVILATAVPAAVAAASAATAWRLRRSLRDASGRREIRARFLAQLGLWLDGLSLMMIAFGAAAVVVFRPCA
ncbi:hypothetical protein [Sinosporangium siamense]|uniref:Transmembrane protein n=1 Tax=Sinosporangium siamense TaxID=1367973 RepID=A0A919RIK7_9ACTN|nr:hypothetical protein [Sinosporangium siamense]GII94536.1 hypothetical protein Ssi02_47670 [Sinosporangium siamense]